MVSSVRLWSLPPLVIVCVVVVVGCGGSAPPDKMVTLRNGREVTVSRAITGFILAMKIRKPDAMVILCRGNARDPKGTQAGFEAAWTKSAGSKGIPLSPSEAYDEFMKRC
jgi:hypothetical protein